jgi:tetratricopeptide (TPR) repeat protein
MTAKVEPMASPPASAISPEADFLFHLYRGSELLHDNRLLEAQSELEYALTLEPSDARTQGLLAIVYFRSGFYARAINTYRVLLRERPNDPTLRLNVALCYLKTGQSQGARIELEALVMENVSDRRAWGYLAVALERLGYVEQAREAFEHAGQFDLAQRMFERSASMRPARLPDVPHEASPVAGGRPYRSKSPTFDDLDGGELSIDLVHAEREQLAPTPATSINPSVSVSIPAPSPSPIASVAPLPALAAAAPPRLDTLGWGTAPRADATPRAWLEAPPLSNFIADARVERLGDAHGVTLLGTRLARVEVDSVLSPAGFAFRLEALRSYSGTLNAGILQRQSRADAPPAHESAGDSFGGIGTPFASIKGPGQVMLAPRTSQRVLAFTLHDEIVFFREEALLGFDLSLHYENGRLGLGGSGDAAPLVQFKGDGTLLLELSTDLLALEVKSGGLTVRKEVVIGWVGRLLPSALSAQEAPAGQRGLIGFSGEGTVLVAAK